MSGTWAWWSMVSLQWGLMSATSPAPVSTICVNYVWWGGVSQRTPLTPLWELLHSRLDYCNSVLAGLPQYSLNKLQSILRASARLVLKLLRIGQCLRLDAGRAPLALPLRIQFKLCCTSSNVSTALHHPTYPSFVNRSPGRRSLSASISCRWRSSNSTLKNCDDWASRIFDIRPSCLEWSSNKLERSYTNFSGLQETIENTLFHDDVKVVMRLCGQFERRITNTSFNSIQVGSRSSSFSLDTFWLPSFDMNPQRSCKNLKHIYLD